MNRHVGVISTDVRGASPMVRLYGPYGLEGPGPVSETVWIVCSGLHASLAVPRANMMVAVGSCDASIGELARKERTFVLVHAGEMILPLLR